MMFVFFSLGNMPKIQSNRDRLLIGNIDWSNY